MSGEDKMSLEEKNVITWNKVAIGVMGLLSIWAQVEYVGFKDSQKMVEQRILNLESQKLDKVEFKEVIARIDENHEKLVFQQERNNDSLKKDILERIELYTQAIIKRDK